MPVRGQALFSRIAEITSVGPLSVVENECAHREFPRRRVRSFPHKNRTRQPWKMNSLESFSGIPVAIRQFEYLRESSVDGA